MKKNTKTKKKKDANLNVKFPTDDYEELQEVAEQIGGMSLSQMIRTVVYERLDRVRKSANPRDFLDT